MSNPLLDKTLPLTTPTLTALSLAVSEATGIKPERVQGILLAGANSRAKYEVIGDVDYNGQANGIIHALVLAAGDDAATTKLILEAMGEALGLARALMAIEGEQDD